MSDYFGALMRSSGITIGGARPVVSPALPSTETNAVAIDIGPSAATPHALGVQAAAALPPRVVSQSQEKPMQQLDTPVQEATAQPDPVAPALGSEFDHLGQTDLGVAGDLPAAASPLPSSASSVQPLLPVQGEALVRAAMQWVASGPQPARPQPATAQGHAAPNVTDVSAPAATAQALRPLDASHEAHPLGTVTAAPTAQERISPRASNPVRDPSAGPARTTHTPTDAPMALLNRDEVVEISIGAINVRVDAPAEQTLAQRRPASPPVPAPRAAGTPLPRSALLRRALRRI